MTTSKVTIEIPIFVFMPIREQPGYPACYHSPFMPFETGKLLGESLVQGGSGHVSRGVLQKRIAKNGCC
jgi:hypothetical protein